MDGVFYGPIWVVFFYVLALVRDDPSMLRLGAWAWLLIVAGLAPFIVWRVGLRKPPGDRWRAAAIFTYTALPLSLLAVPGWWGSGDEGLLFTLPSALVWGIGGQILAMRRTPEAPASRRRAMLLAPAAIVCGLVALPLFAFAGVGLLMAVWEPPAMAWLFTPIIIGVSLPTALACAYASVKMLTDAQRAWRTG